MFLQSPRGGGAVLPFQLVSWIGQSTWGDRHTVILIIYIYIIFIHLFKRIITNSLYEHNWKNFCFAIWIWITLNSCYEVNALMCECTHVSAHTHTSDADCMKVAIAACFCLFDTTPWCFFLLYSTEIFAGHKMHVTEKLSHRIGHTIQTLRVSPSQDKFNQSLCKYTLNWWWVRAP